MERVCSRSKLARPRLRQRDIEILQQYDWHGNVRELQNVIERAVIRARGDPLQFDLPVSSKNPARILQSRCNPRSETGGTHGRGIARAGARQPAQGPGTDWGPNFRAGRRCRGSGNPSEYTGLPPEKSGHQVKALIRRGLQNRPVRLALMQPSLVMIRGIWENSSSPVANGLPIACETSPSRS